MSDTIRGTRTRINVTTDVKTRDVDEKVTFIKPNRTPFVAMLGRLPSKTTDQVKFEHGELDYQRKTVQVDGALNSSATALVLDTGHVNVLKRYTQLRNKTTGEVMRVTDVNTASRTATIVRGAAGSTAGSIADNEVLAIVSEAAEEASDFGTAVTNTTDLSYNYTEQIETIISTSWRQKGTRDYTTPDYKEKMAQASVEHNEKISAAFWLGERDLFTGDEGGQVSYTGGIDWFIRQVSGSHDTTTSGKLTPKKVLDWLVNVYQFGSEEDKFIFGSPVACMALNYIATGPVTIEQSADTMGIKIAKINVNGHLMKVIEERILGDLGFTNRLYCVDMSLVRRRVLAANGMNFSTRWYRDIQSPRSKKQEDALFCDVGLHMKNTRAHGRLIGFDT